MKRTIILSLAVLALVVGGWWLMRWQQPGTAHPPVPGAPAPSPGLNSETKSVSGTATNSPPAAAAPDNRPKAQPPKAVISLKEGVDPAKKATVAGVLADLNKQYGYAGALGWDEARALLARREQATRALLNQLAGLGPGGARAIGATYAETEDMRGKLLLIDALGKIQDGEAGEVLRALFGSESSFNLQREMVAALGQRQDAAAVEALGEIAASQTDARLRFAAAQALSGRPDALPVLAQLIQTESDPNVRKELIQSAGAIGNDAALRVVAGIAQGALDLDVRQTAIQVLGRNFGAGALNTFKQLLGDPDVAIRQNVLTALAAVHSDDAVSLLQKAAASDSSEQVREQARALLSAASVQ
jgi:HEAT repeat protein